MIKGIKTKVIDVANTLNLSSTVIRLIEKRSARDKWVLFGGMIATCIVMFLIVRWFA